jgi:hypothetical protein
MQYKDVASLVRSLEQEDNIGETTISKYVTFNLRENIEKIDAYLNSKHISGDKDSKGRDKPFFNIVTAAVNIWYRATALEWEKIRINATKGEHKIFAFIATILLQEWMKKSSFGKFVTKWGLTLARYGSAVSKFVEKDGELHCEVIPWNRLICDPIDFDNNPKIEKLWLTPAQLKMKTAYNQDMVDKLLLDVSTRQTMGGQKKDNRQNYILIYEVHGNLPLSYKTGKEKDEDNYTQQMFAISFLAKKDKGDGYNDYTLYAGKEEKDPYYITHLIEEDGRTISRGAVENLFEAQWMTNHTIKSIKDQLDLASKLIFQTSDGNFVGLNALNSIENGDIMIHKINEPLTELNNSSHDITSLQSFGNQWMALGDRVTNTPEAQRGESPNSGTAWRLQETIIQQSQSLFDEMTKNKRLALKEMLRIYVIPFFKKKMDTKDEISAILSDQQINKLDAMYIPNEAIKRANEQHKEMVLNGEDILPGQQEANLQSHTQNIQAELNQDGNQRFFKPSDVGDTTWKKALEGLEWDADIDMPGDKANKEDLATLTTVFQTIANPMTAQVLQTPEGKLIFNKILEISGGVSPIEIQGLPKMQPAPQVVGGGVPVAPNLNNNQQ